ncbi:MAG: phage portal protein [Acidobacteria bacterium]|nr:phage portal protein [Acidobacteriota bacterium]
MNITENLRGVLRRLAGRRASGAKRRTLPLPSILNSYGPRADRLPKPTPANLRRFAETPVARKAINTIKDRVAGMRWRVQPKNARDLGEVAEGAERIRVLTDNFDAPNPDDSFRSLAEQVLEDVIVGGFGAIELQLTGDTKRPLALWPVDGATIRLRTDWDGEPSSPRYAQATGRFGPEAHIELADNELIYIRLNPRSHTPFGLGRLEVAFETINAFLGAHRYAARLASNSVVQYALWLQDLTPAHQERLIRWWQDEIEGTGRVPILSVEHKPEVLRFGGGTDSDLRIAWQELLLRVIADAFDLPPMLLGLEHDVNRTTAAELNDIAFRSAIVPTARLFAEHLTRDAIGKKLGWTDLEFVFTDVDARNEKEEAEIHEILLRNGVLTVNEVRRMRGLPEIEPSALRSQPSVSQP